MKSVKKSISSSLDQRESLQNMEDLKHLLKS